MEIFYVQCRVFLVSPIEFVYCCKTLPQGKGDWTVHSTLGEEYWSTYGEIQMHDSNPVILVYKIQERVNWVFGLVRTYLSIYFKHVFSSGIVNLVQH